MPAGMRGFAELQLCKYTCAPMDRWHATLILISVLAMADVAGVARFWEAWTAHHGEPASQVTPAPRARPATTSPAGDAPAAHAGA